MIRFIQKLFGKTHQQTFSEKNSALNEEIKDNHPVLEEEFFRPFQGLELKPYLASGDLQGIHHLARYHWATIVLEQINPGRIIDIACGAGYGSFILASKLIEWHVTGVDYDPRAIETARTSYFLNNLTFIEGDMATWKSNHPGQSDELGKFSAVLSFDTIEHLDHPEIALLRIVENLEDDGIFLLSTPISFPSTNLKPGWSAHKIEYGASDLVNILKRFFKNVSVPEDGTLPSIDFWKDLVNKDQNRYLNITNPIVCKYPIKSTNN